MNVSSRDVRVGEQVVLVECLETRVAWQPRAVRDLYEKEVGSVVRHESVPSMKNLEIIINAKVW